jgi:hypothetical protein
VQTNFEDPTVSEFAKNEEDSNNESGGVESSEDPDFVEIDKDEEKLPFPVPPLFNPYSNEKKRKDASVVIDVTRENWEEGCDTKRKAYERLRVDKNRMFEENKIWKKYTSIFKGLKRCHQRAKKPNKITEYEVPRDPTRFNKKIDDFDPAMLLEIEYE